MTTREVSMLVEMGFSIEKAEKALSVTGNNGVEPATEWLLSHADEQSEPSSSTTSLKESEESKEGNGDNSANLSEKDSDNKSEEAKSFKCNDCQRLFQTQLDIEYHAAKTGHSDFSESTEEKKPLTEEERKEQVRLLEEKMKQKRKEREEKERQDELDREKRRIQSGKEIAAMKEKMKENEMKKAIEQRKREKIEDQKARQRVKEQIEADRAARKMKFGETATSPTAPSTSVTNSVKPTKDYSETRLQMRLTNGQALTHTFGSKEQLSAVRLYIEMNRTDGSEPFSLMTSFPKKLFSEEDFEKPLETLGLVPSAVIIVTRKV